MGELGPWGIYQNLMVSCYDIIIRITSAGWMSGFEFQAGGS